MDIELQISIADFLPRSRVNGPGLRSVLWVQGCPFRCQDCFNPDFLPFAGGRQLAVQTVAAWLLAEQTTEGVSFSGGEPFAQPAALAALVAKVKAAGKGVLIFTGFEWAVLQASRHPAVQALLAMADLLVCGPYVPAQISRKPLLGSTNQQLVYLTERYRHQKLGQQRMEIRIAADGELAISGFIGNKSIPAVMSGFEGKNLCNN